MLILSTVFRDMLDVKPPTHTYEADRSVNIDSSAEDVELLLDLVIHPTKSELKEKAWASYKQVLNLCPRYGFEGVSRIITTYVANRVDDSPLEIFVYASQIDDFPLAKACIVALAIRARCSPTR